ncbi:hypothetical protein [Vibrio harveyi]|uniref:hypothetical protein n=1 Tax=Vibrio harveyi TaxID=669 RepID=UPI003CE96052
MAIQKITSLQTSRNQVPRAISLNVGQVLGKHVLNFGCGKYPLRANEVLLKQGALSICNYDPYAIKNDVENNLADIPKSYDVVYCCNVLNVLEDVSPVIEQLLSIDFDTLIIQIYEGNKSQIGRVTRDGYQRNEVTKEYEKYFDDVTRKGNVLVIKKGQR